MEVHCCKCAKSRDEHGWRWMDRFTDGPVSYSYCPECLDEFRYEAGLRRSDQVDSVTPLLLAAACA